MRQVLRALLVVIAGCKTEGQTIDPPPPDPPPPPPPPPVVDPCATSTPRDPGRVTIHRLNRTEYNHTIRDLIGDDSAPADDFPADDFGYGFDNIADVLSISPLHIEKYELASEAIVGRALVAPFAGPESQVFEAEAVGSAVGAASGEAWNLWSNGEISVTYDAEIEGEYELSSRAWSTPAGPEPARMEMILDGRSLQIFDVSQVEASPGIFVHRTRLTAGGHTLTVGFINDYYEPPDDRNLLVDWIQIEGPFDAPPPENPEAYAAIMICDPTVEGRGPCAARILEAFASRAWRRPATPQEVDRLVLIADIVDAEGDSFDVQISVALQAILLSPHFVFRVELDPAPADPTPHPLTPHELASRLSYFLWSSMPDQELFDRAADGTLADPQVLAVQVRRMLGDPRSDALIENFVGQWMSTRALADVNPDYARYPDWDEELSAAFDAETKLFVKEIVSTDRSALELIDADFTYLNDRLARHYGLPAVGTSQMTRVALTSDQRGGLLRQGSFLTVTSHPRRTSPVKRGKFVLEQLLCVSPPDPPPDVEAFPEEVDPTASLRERFEQHRSDARCQPCHAVMDPIGFGLENYDGIGAWRETDDGFPIDPSGQLAEGPAFTDATGLLRAIQSDPRVPECLARQLMTYGLGRGLSGTDLCHVRDVTTAFAAGGHSLESAMIGIATSPVFTSRRGEPE
jgi:hypothetical protein